MKPIWASESTVSMPVGIDRGMNALMAFPGLAVRVRGVFPHARDTLVMPFLDQ